MIFKNFLKLFLQNKLYQMDGLIYKISKYGGEDSGGADCMFLGSIFSFPKTD